MFGMGGSEILVILIVALIFLGPDKLPDAADGDTWEALGAPLP